MFISYKRGKASPIKERREYSAGFSSALHPQTKSNNAKMTFVASANRVNMRFKVFILTTARIKQFSFLVFCQTLITVSFHFFKDSVYFFRLGLFTRIIIIVVTPSSF